MCKSFVFLLSIIVLLGPATMVSAVELKVDVGCPDQEAAGNLKEGWVAFNGTACSGAVGPVTVTDIGGTGIDVAVTVGNTSDNAYRSPGGYTGDELGRDYVSADDGASQADCKITMTLSNLPEAGYTLTSYHNCPDHPDPKATIDITVSGGGVVGTPTNASGVAQTTLSENVAFDDIGKGTVQFVADGAGEVIVTFTAREEAHKWRIYLNGFELSGVSLTPEIEFESAASGEFESVSPVLIAVILRNPEEGQTYTVDYAVTGGTATNGVDYTLAGACSCDFDGSGQVNFGDLAIFVENWLSQAAGNLADVTDDNAVDFMDYAACALEWLDSCGGTTLQFTPGETSKTISIDIVDDGLDEDDETIELTLSNPTNAAVGLTRQHTFTILDNELTAGLIGFASVSASGLNGTTGGAGGPTVTVTNSSDFLDYISRDGPYIIGLSGTISLSGMNKVKSDKSIIGLGSDAVITGGGLNLSEVSNVIIQNITFTNASDDSINLQTYTHHVWIDHCDFSNGYDGLIDIKRGTDYVTVSWNHFYNHHKTMLLGHSDDNSGQDIGHLKVTYHHNWFDGTSTRHPRARFGKVHAFNNYYLNNSGYGVASTCDADVVVESNYFQNVPSPALVGYGSSWDGDLVEKNNIFVNSGRPETRGSAFEPSSYYSYTCDSAFDVPARVKTGAGVGKL